MFNNFNQVARLVLWRNMKIMIYAQVFYLCYHTACSSLLYSHGLLSYFIWVRNLPTALYKLIPLLTSQHCLYPCPVIFSALYHLTLHTINHTHAQISISVNFYIPPILELWLRKKKMWHGWTMYCHGISRIYSATLQHQAFFLIIILRSWLRKSFGVSIQRARTKLKKDFFFLQNLESQVVIPSWTIRI